MTAPSDSGTLRTVRNPRRRKLAASFVVTVSAVPAAASLEGCKKVTIVSRDAAGGGGGGGDALVATSTIVRTPEGCALSVSMACPPNVSCNPPPLEPIDCPEDADAGGATTDAGRADAGTPARRRPPGKEDWLRMKPRLDVSDRGCTYVAERFCTPPSRPFTCTEFQMPTPVKCTPIAADAGPNGSRAAPTRFRIEPFVYKDGTDVCHAVPAFECETQAVPCTAAMPEGTVTECP